MGRRKDQQAEVSLWEGVPGEAGVGVAPVRGSWDGEDTARNDGEQSMPMV